MKTANPISVIAVLAALGGVAGSFAIIAWGQDAIQTQRQRIATLIASAAGGFLVGLPMGMKFGLKWFNIRSPQADDLTIYSFGAVLGAFIMALTFLAGGIARGLSNVDFGEVFWHFLDSVRPASNKPQRRRKHEQQNPRADSDE